MPTPTVRAFLSLIPPPLRPAARDPALPAIAEIAAHAAEVGHHPGVIHALLTRRGAASVPYDALADFVRNHPAFLEWCAERHVLVPAYCRWRDSWPPSLVDEVAAAWRGLETAPALDSVSA